MSKQQINLDKIEPVYAALFGELTNKPELFLSVLKQLGKKDLYFFTKYILNFEDLEWDVHKPVCDFLQSIDKAKEGEPDTWLLLDPRGWFKSTICTAMCIQDIINNPSIRILLGSLTITNASKFLNLVARPFLRNDLFRSLYPEVIPDLSSAYHKSVRWNSFEIEVPRPSGVMELKEPTVACAGIDTAVTGGHFDKIYCDDLVTLKNITTKEMMQKPIDFLAECRSLRERYEGGAFAPIIVTGTRWDKNDAYGKLSDNNTDLGRGVKKFVRPAITPDGKSTFPSRHPIERLQQERMKIGNYRFSAIYQNNPTDPSAAIFHRNQFKLYQSLFDLPDNMELTMVIEPACTEDVSADYTAISVVGRDKHNFLYLLDNHAVQKGPGDVIDLIFEVWLGWTCRGNKKYYHEKNLSFNEKKTRDIKWNTVYKAIKEKRWTLHKVGCERVALSKYLEFGIKKEARERMYPFYVRPLIPRTTQSKIMRIRGFQPYVQNETFFVHTSHEDVIQQFCDFPHGNHDDIIDGIAYHLELIRPMFGFENAAKARYANKYIRKHQQNIVSIFGRDNNLIQPKRRVSAGYN